MSYPINYPTPQNANVQIFYGSETAYINTARTWVKPQGASFVWFTLIGSGQSGNGSVGGGSGAVTNFMCPAFLIPDSLRVTVPNWTAGIATQIIYQQKEDTGYQLLFANPANGTNGGAAMTANFFTAMGFFQSVAGDNGSAANVPAASATFLSGGGGPGSPQVSNYGYTTNSGSATNSNGFFQMQPIMVGAGGMGDRRGGIGCGGGRDSGAGGNGLAVIITW
jgi:hypothetical protein